MSTQEHPRHARSHIYSPTTVGAWAADKLTTFTGSWWFVGIHVLWFGLWFLLRVEPFPFGFLTLCVSLEAIFLSTFVMMSQNGAYQRDRKRDDLEASEISQIFASHQELLTINHNQVAILNQQSEILALLRAQSEARLRKRQIPTELPVN